MAGSLVNFKKGTKMIRDILRLEYNKDNNDNIVYIFLQVSVSTDDNNNSVIGEYILTENEMNEVILDTTNLKNIIEKLFAETEISLDLFMNNKAKDTVFPLLNPPTALIIKNLIDSNNIQKIKDDLLKTKKDLIK